VLSACIFAVVFTYPIVVHLSTTSLATNDWDVHLEYAWVAWHSVAHFGQVPHWDPYKCGGLPLLADPQARVIAPFFILHLIFGPIVGLHLEMILHVAVGWVGGYFLGRQIGLGIVPSMVCASLFPSSSWMYLHLAEGHIVFMALEYVPWILMMWLRSIDSTRVMTVAIGGLISAIAFAESGVYVVYLTIPLLLAIGGLLAVQNRSIKPLSKLAVMAVFAVGFAAVKLLPALALGITRAVDSPEWSTPWLIAQELFSRDQNHNRYIIGMYWEFHEYGAYVEPFFAVLAILGAMRFFKRAVPWIAGALTTLALSFGSPVWWAPWPLLHRLPFYSFEHAPSRFLIPFVMALAPLAGLGAEAVVSRHGKWAQITIVAFLVAALADAAIVNNPNLHIALQGRPDVRERSPEFRQFRSPIERQMYSIALSNQGTLNCYGYPILGFHPTAYNDIGYRGEQYLTSSGSVKLAEWSPNQLGYELDLPSSSTLVVNQNFDRGWLIAQGTGRLFEKSGLIAIELPKGRQRLRLVYRTRGLTLGLTVTLITIIITSGLALQENSRQRRG
jgi:hypothetical protein